jgi:2,5-diketo-D-gluconate reductase A
VGAAVRSSELPRRDLFVTTKLWNDDQGYDSALRAFDRSLAELELDYVDLYLIHWPAASRGLYIETWRALERILADGRARSIGVSNFQVEHLTRLLDVSDTVPAVNQIELHPRLQQKQLREFHARHGIVTQAWSPLARGAFLDDPVIGTIAAEHAVTPARVVLRWHLQLGNAIIPKSATPSRIEENLDLFSFELDDAELSAISRLDTGERTGPDPDRMT